MKNIHIIGIGMGNPDTITLEGLKKIRKSDFLIGASRMLKAFSAETDAPQAEAVAPDKILSLIEDRHEGEEIAVLMSGDTGFFSGTKKLIQGLSGREDLIWDVTPGISSLQYLAARNGISWDDVNVSSLHGREKNVLAEVSASSKTFFLLGSNMTAEKVCRILTEGGMGSAEVIIGERLSYEDERITCGTAEELASGRFDPLGVMFVFGQAEKGRLSPGAGIPDEAFVRGSVPMTKEEVRTVSVSKLRCEREDIVYDIGAGTGSVTVALAAQAPAGKVFAIETNPEGVRLIRENANQFRLNHIQVVEGMAPAVLSDLPAPDKVFIGGSKGNLDEIVRAVLEKNPQARLVVNAIALETLAEAESVFQKYGLADVETVQLSVAKAKKVGAYHMMNGQNPVFIISGQGYSKYGEEDGQTV